MKKEETMYVDGVKHGESTTWYKNGHVLNTENYSNGMLHGVCTRYERFIPGVATMFVENYVNGLRDGVQRITGIWYQKRADPKDEWDWSFVEDGRDHYPERYWIEGKRVSAPHFLGKSAQKGLRGLFKR